jgi:hypothetical protein
MSKPFVLLLVAGLASLLACAPVVGQSDEPRDLPISASWVGDYPVAALDQLPAGQQQNRVGSFSDAASFAKAWESFRPGEAVPAIDFANNLVIFSRNVDFYNRTNIFKVTLTAGVIEILAMETMSARPIEQQAAMAMAVVPRAGVKAIRLDETTTVPVD